LAAAENGLRLNKKHEDMPQGLKPNFYEPSTARLKPRPFKTRFMQPTLVFPHFQACGRELHSA
jgi:hypothetical protein